MQTIAVSIAAVVVGISLLQLANGFLGTLVSIRTTTEGFTPMASCLPAITEDTHWERRRLGRFCSALATFVSLPRLRASSPGPSSCNPFWFRRWPGSSYGWITGIGCAALFITPDSWLNTTSSPQNRGTIFAIYMVATNAAFGGGQFLINLPSPGGYKLFLLAAALICLALIPVGLTRATVPSIPASPRLSLREMRRIAPAAPPRGWPAAPSTTCLIPAYGQAQGVSAGAISGYIATAIFGDLAFQIPVGKLSDRFDLRMVAAGIALGLCVSALCLVALPQTKIVLIFTFVFGGFLSYIYSVAVAHPNDRVGPEYIVSLSSS